MEPIRILIVEDHPVVRMGLQMMLRNEADMTVVGTAASGDEAVCTTYLPGAVESSRD